MLQNNDYENHYLYLFTQLYSRYLIIEQFKDSIQFGENKTAKKFEPAGSQASI